MHEVLVNRLGGLSLPRKSVVTLTDRPDMTLDVYCGRKTTIQQQQQLCSEKLDKKKLENDYMIMPENFNKNYSKRGGPDPLPPHLHHHQKKKKQIWILCQNSLTRELKIRVVGFVLKKLLTYFEMLIVPHALQCVYGCFFVFYLI